MSIAKILSLAFFAFAISSCDKNHKSIKSIIDFTPKLKQEISNFKPVLPTIKTVESWPGVNFVNEIDGNFQVADLNFKFIKSSINTPDKIVSAPVIKDGKLFILDSKNNVVCYDLESQKQVWRTNLSIDSNSSSIPLGGITLDSGRLYVVNNSRSVVVLESSSGYEVSRLKLGDIIISPVTLDAHNLYVLTADNQMTAFEKKTLSTLWRVNGAQTSLSLLIQSFTQPIVVKNFILTEFYSGQIIATEPDGNSRWQIALNPDLEDFGDMEHANLSSQAVVDGENVFMACSAGSLSKARLKDGQIVWKKEVADILAMNKFGNMLVATTNGQEIVALSEHNGEIAWVLDLTANEKKYKTPYNLLTPFMANDLIYVASTKGLLYEISLSGALLKTYAIPKGTSFYALHKGKIYLFAKNSVFVNSK